MQYAQLTTSKIMKTCALSAYILTFVDIIHISSAIALYGYALSLPNIFRKTI